ncbi:MAG: asparagine synthase (glutamine-hydrolyzing) [Chitinophagales bacterium]
MCGIAGIISTNQHLHTQAVLQKMADSLQHRGPDGNGSYTHSTVSLVHTRLSIIDPSLGKQPMLSADKNLAITFNGEIYNYKELKAELRHSGFTFNTDSDTEVILYAYQKWGKECVKRFRGMFAFCIADFRKQTCFLARDPLGIKPLVFYQNNHVFAFASEIQALKTIPQFDQSIELASLDYYLWLSYIPAPYSIYKKVKKLLPAHCMEVDFNGSIVSNECFWKLEFKPNYKRSSHEWIERTGEVIKQSVQAHLVSDVPFGAFLSGGIDSTLVVKYMSELLSTPVKTFTISFEEQDFNELPYAQQAAKILGVEHHHETVKADALGILPQLVKHYGEPYADSSAVPTYYVSKMARKHVPMVLSGDGGDECFLGYPRYAEWLKYLDRKLAVPAWKAALLPMAHKLFPQRYAPLRPTPNVYSFLRFTEYLKHPVRQQLWRSEFHSSIQTRWLEIENEFKSLAYTSKLNKAKHTDQKSYMVYDVLTKVDAASMMNSLEVRTPIIDKDVFEFAATIPPEVMLNMQQGNQPQEKFLLKSLLATSFPDNFIHRRKAGFGMPLQHWLDVNNGKLFPEIRARLCNKNSRLSEYFTESGIDLLINKREYERHIGTEQVVWQLLFLDEWLNLQ